MEKEQAEWQQMLTEAMQSKEIADSANERAKKLTSVDVQETIGASGSPDLKIEEDFGIRGERRGLIKDTMTSMAGIIGRLGELNHKDIANDLALKTTEMMGKHNLEGITNPDEMAANFDSFGEMVAVVGNPGLMKDKIAYLTDEYANNFEGLANAANYVLEQSAQLVIENMASLGSQPETANALVADIRRLIGQQLTVQRVSENTDQLNKQCANFFKNVPTQGNSDGGFFDPNVKTPELGY